MTAQSQAREAKPRVGSPTTPTADLFRLDGRTILITGGGGSVALEVASSILESGGDVICLDRAAVALPDLWTKVNKVANTFATKVWYYQCDVTDVADVRMVFDESMKHIRYPFRGMVCCAGVSGGGPSIDFPVDEFRKIMDVNYFGTFVCCQAAGRELKKQNQPGSVVLIASISGHRSNKGLDTLAYNSSKSAVLQLSRSLAAEWGSTVGMPCIRVNTLSPGYIRTRLTAGELKNPATETQWAAGNMLNRLSTADEYRGPTMFLLSDASSYMTGADIIVDGGHTAW